MGIIDTDGYMKMKNPLNADWIVSHVSYAGDDCLKWPFGGTNGYGVLKFQGEMVYAHRLMCDLVHGPSPSPEHQASHSCGNGHLGCVNPRHLSWKTASENQQDRIAHGRAGNGWLGKITQKEADEIRSLKGKVTQKRLAEIYGITRSSISAIHTGNAWTGPNKYTRAREKLRDLTPSASA